MLVVGLRLLATVPSGLTSVLIGLSVLLGTNHHEDYQLSWRNPQYYELYQFS
jgi:hypothetical protein